MGRRWLGRLKILRGREYYPSANEREEEVWRPEQMRRVSSSTKDMLALHAHANVGYGSVRVQG